MQSGKEVIIDIYVANSTNSPIQGATVSIMASNGTFLSVVNGDPPTFLDNLTVEAVSNASGYVRVLWKAPITNFLFPTIDIQFVADVFYQSEGISITLIHNLVVSEPDVSMIQNIATNMTSEIQAGSTLSIKTEIKDTQNQPATGVQVTMQTGVGNFSETQQSQVQKITNENGIVIASWQAPNLTIDNPIVNDTLDIFVEAAPNVNNSISVPFAVLLTANGTITLNIFSPEKVNESQIVSLAFNVNYGNTSASGAEIQISAERGLFNNDQGSFSLSDKILVANETGFAQTQWQAPILDGNNAEISVFSVIVQYGEKSIFDQFEISVSPILSKASIQWLSETEGWIQNKTIPVKLKVLDPSTALPIENATVQLSSEIGIWNETHTSTVELLTSTDGIAIAHLDLSDVSFEFEFNEVQILATVAGKKLTTITSNITLNVQRVITYPEGTSTISKSTISQGENVTVSVSVTQNGLKAQGITVELIATAGSFPQSQSGIKTTYRIKTDANGEVKAIWAASDLPASSNDNLTIYITVNLIYEGKSIEVNIHKIDVLIPKKTTEANQKETATNPFESADLSDPGNKQTQLLGSTVLIGVILGASVGVIVIMRKVKKA